MSFVIFIQEQKKSKEGALDEDSDNEVFSEGEERC